MGSLATWHWDWGRLVLSHDCIAANKAIKRGRRTEIFKRGGEVLFTRSAVEIGQEVFRQKTKGEPGGQHDDCENRRLGSCRA